MNKHDNEQWRSFKKERPGRGHYQVSLVPRDGHKGFCMYLLSFRPWCEDYEE